MGIYSAEEIARLMFPTAYECIFPGCLRKYSTMSNMRRHLRGHYSSNYIDALNVEDDMYLSPMPAAVRAFGEDTAEGQIRPASTPASLFASRVLPTPWEASQSSQ